MATTNPTATGDAAAGDTEDNDSARSDGGTSTVDVATSEAGDTAVRSRASFRLLIGATALACLPIAVAAFRAVRAGWLPTGDDAFPAIRAHDVFSTHPPLIGWWSSASQYAGRELNHPGPLQFDFLAIPVWLFGPSVGTIVGTALINAVCVVGIVWLLRRRLDLPSALLAAGAAALLVWSLGSDTLYDPWTMMATLLPFALFLVAAWGLASGDLVAAPIMIVAGSFALQTHLTYALLTPGIALVAVAWLAGVVLLRRRRGTPPTPAAKARALRWGALTVVLGLLTWAQPLYENFVAPEGPEGNLRALVGSLDVEQQKPSVEQAIGAFGGTVAVPPMWLPPSYASPSYGTFDPGPPLWLSIGALVLLAAALGFFGVRALRRGSSAVAAGTVVALACLPLGIWTMLRMPMPFIGVPMSYSRFMWPLGMVVWLALAVAVLDEVRARLPRLTLSRLAIPGLALALLGGVAGLPTAHREGEPEWTWRAVEAVDDDMVQAIKEAGGGPVLVDAPYHTTTGYLVPPLLYKLQDAGIDFYVLDPSFARQVGMNRLYDDTDDAPLKLVILAGNFVQLIGTPAPLVASWSQLSDAQREEYDALTAEVRALVVEHGVVLNADGRRQLEEWGENGETMLGDLDEAQSDPDIVLLPERTLLELWTGFGIGEPLIDEDIYPADVMDRWVELGSIADDRQVEIRLEPCCTDE